MKCQNWTMKREKNTLNRWNSSLLQLLRGDVNKIKLPTCIFFFSVCFSSQTLTLYLYGAAQVCFYWDALHLPPLRSHDILFCFLWASSDLLSILCTNKNFSVILFLKYEVIHGLRKSTAALSLSCPRQTHRTSISHSASFIQLGDLCMGFMSCHTMCPCLIHCTLAIVLPAGMRGPDRGRLQRNI